MTEELFEVTVRESDLFSSHLWQVTNFHLLAFSVTGIKKHDVWVLQELDAPLLTNSGENMTQVYTHN